MSPFAARPWRVSTLSPDDRVPAGFEALSDALDGAGLVSEVVAEIGRRGARDGEPIDDLLARLASTYEAAGGILAEPPFEVVRALTGAWADASLRYLHAVSCEDPLTGLASLAHVRTRILEIYREAARTGIPAPPNFALLVVELKWSGDEASPFDRLLRLVDIAEIIRTVYDGEETVGQLSGNRAVALVRRDARIGDSISGLLGLLQEWQEQTTIGTRLWIEGLPASTDSVEVLLDELAR
jgi:hypothetical protein